MIPSRIKIGIEKSPQISDIVGLNGSMGNTQNWSGFSRTVFERIAKKINQEVTAKVLEKPKLAYDFVLFGEDELKSILFKQSLENIEEFIVWLKSLSVHAPYTWISGKTLESYWNNGRAKFKKLNVLLVFLGTHENEWDDWKFKSDDEQPNTPSPISQNKSGSMGIIKKHFIGQYFRYYQKYIGRPSMIKAPVVLEEMSSGEIIAKTKTVGHNYQSSHLSIRNGVLYFDFENLDWDDRESHIYNVGLETHAKMLVGVSNSLNRRGEATALRNILLRQEVPYDYSICEVREIDFDEKNVSKEDKQVIEFLKKSTNNIITTGHHYSLDDLEDEYD